MNLSGWDTVLTDLASDLNVAENGNCMEVLDKIVESIKSLNCEVGCTFEKDLPGVAACTYTLASNR